MDKKYFIALALFIPTLLCAQTPERPIVESKAYRWVADSVIQGGFKAYAVNEYEIVSDYHAKPGYGFPIEQKWVKKNDLSEYPVLKTSNKLHAAIFNMGLDEMVNAVEPDTTLRTGKEWAGVWTRDVSYSIMLSMAALQPEASRISLEHKISADGRIIQDTGSGGAWPVSSDREIWAVAAYEVYKATGDQAWLEKIYPVIKRSLEADYIVLKTETGLVKGETSFIDWRKQSYPKWMQMTDIYISEALGTSCIHVQAWRTLGEIATRLGKNDESETYFKRAQTIADAINEVLWCDELGYYAMYAYGREYQILNKRAETLGESLAILFGIAPEDRAKSITENNPITPYGPAIFYPQIPDVPSYHNNALWPFVASFWTLANARVGNEEGVMQGFGSIFRPAALFATNKENFNLDNGDIETELNSSNMLWSLSGNLALTMKILFGINYEADGIRFTPFVPEAMDDSRELNSLKYRDAVLNITVNGHGDRIKSFKLNGVEQEAFIPAGIKGVNDICIVMADNDIVPMKVNFQPNLKTPVTPIARLYHDPSVKSSVMNNRLEWNPIEDIDHYIVLRDGAQITRTHENSVPADVPGQYQVVGVSASGVESFASQPMSNFPEITYQFPKEVTAISSAEACYLSSDPVAGYTGEGFIEVDHTQNTEVVLEVRIKKPGCYSVSYRYTNGNGPISTENKCAVRGLYVDGVREGTVVMPHRGSGNWCDWGETNAVVVDLPAGKHRIVMKFDPCDENINMVTNHALVDRLIIRKID